MTLKNSVTKLKSLINPHVGGFRLSRETVVILRLEMKTPMLAVKVVLVICLRTNRICYG